MDIFKVVGRLALEGLDDFNRDLDGASKNGYKFSATIGKGIVTATKVGIAAITATGTAMVALGKASLDAYADFEQLVGGVETLFGAGGKSLEDYAASVGKTVEDATAEYNSLMQAQSAVLTNASNAWFTAGMSANEYIETVTGFSASLIGSLDGDTARAAEIADMAIRDMSDNANKMGTDIGSIQNAYQGFAKQNYTMLDNLKLGYGGTREEMQRLIDDANRINRENGIITNYTIDNMGDIIEAIHVIQDDMGIYGTTAEEASKTITGSINAMKAAWQNLVTGLSDPDQDLSVLVQNFSDSIVTVGKNILPRIKILLPRITEGLGTLANGILPELISTAIGALPEFFTLAGDLLSGIASIIGEQFPALLAAAVDILGAFQSAIVGTDWNQLGQDTADMLATIDWSGAITQVFEAIGAALGALGGFLIGLFSDAWDAVVEYMSEWITKGEEMGMDTSAALLAGILAGLVDLAVWCYDNIIEPLIEGIIDGMTGVEGTGEEVVESIKKGIKDAWEGLKTWFKNLWDGLFGNLETTVTVNKENNTGSGTDGSHANGLSYVPFDGYISELHKGEMVLTRAEAEAFRRGLAFREDSGETRNRGNSNGITIIQNIQTVPMTPVELAAASQSYFEQARWAL